jgi:uncharacterized protein (TIGR03435 family)
VYALTMGKNGPKLKQGTPPRTYTLADGTPVEVHGIDEARRFPGPDGTPRVRMSFRSSTLQDAADSLAPYFDRPVLDRTGLTGRYDFVIEYDVDNSAPKTPAVENTSGLGGGYFNPYTGLTGSALSVALQDVGLKLESTKAPVEVLVIDHVEKPSEN